MQISIIYVFLSTPLAITIGTRSGVALNKRHALLEHSSLNELRQTIKIMLKYVYFLITPLWSFSCDMLV